MKNFFTLFILVLYSFSIPAQTMQTVRDVFNYSTGDSIIYKYWNAYDNIPGPNAPCVHNEFWYGEFGFEVIHKHEDSARATYIFKKIPDSTFDTLTFYHLDSPLAFNFYNNWGQLHNYLTGDTSFQLDSTYSPFYYSYYFNYGYDYKYNNITMLHPHYPTRYSISGLDIVWHFTTIKNKGILEFNRSWAYQGSTAGCGTILYDGYTISKLITDSVVFINNLPSSITDIKNANISVYPNPVKDKLFIAVDNHSHTPIEFIVYNTLGVKITSSAYSPIDVSSLSTGIYFLKLNQDSEYHTTKFYKE